MESRGAIVTLMWLMEVLLCIKNGPIANSYVINQRIFLYKIKYFLYSDCKQELLTTTSVLDLDKEEGWRHI
jgi:hypothetical protein